ncbi:hypothetical protein ACFVWN_20415 [Nocardiopsis flavescens]|uniref:hypothetical protein n=1 Tax=Nocardiopsis flavescens TaxID=758803 RepID=UPI00365B2777
MDDHTRTPRPPARGADVIPLHPTYPERTCPCGAAWFTLHRPDGRPGAVCLDETGRITGYTGIPHCAECGAQ